MAGAILRYAHVLVGKERTSGSFDSEAEKSGRRRVLFQFTGHDNKSGFKKKSKSLSICFEMIIKIHSQFTGHRSQVTVHRSPFTVMVKVNVKVESKVMDKVMVESSFSIFNFNFRSQVMDHGSR